MKVLILIFILSNFQLFASEGEIKLLKKTETKRMQVQRKGESTSALMKLKASNEELKKLLLQKTSTPLIWDGGKKILTGKVFKGRLLNSIVSTNLESPVLVEVYENQGLPYGSKFSCQGVTKFKRVHTYCNKLVNSQKEVSVNVQILNTDGSSGLLGIYDDGKEDLITGAIASNMAQGILSAAQSKVSTPFGEVTQNNLKNELLGGAIASGKTASDIMLEEMKTKEPVVMIDAGKEVLIYFMEAADVF